MAAINGEWLGVVMRCEARPTPRGVSSGRSRGFAAAALGLGLAWATLAAADEQCTGDGPHLKVFVEGFRSSQGYVSVELYPDDPKRFPARNAQVVVGHDRLTRKGAVVCLSVPRTGYYALAVYHDENGDDQFNRDSLGLPLEGIGLSNNPKILFGLPAFHKVRFYIGEGETTQRIKLRYFGGKAATDRP